MDAWALSARLSKSGKCPCPFKWPRTAWRTHSTCIFARWCSNEDPLQALRTCCSLAVLESFQVSSWCRKLASTRGNSKSASNTNLSPSCFSKIQWMLLIASSDLRRYVKTFFSRHQPNLHYREVLETLQAHSALLQLLKLLEHIRMLNKLWERTLQALDQVAVLTF